MKECEHVCALTCLASVIDHMGLIQIRFSTAATVSHVSKKKNNLPFLVVFEKRLCLSILEWVLCPNLIERFHNVIKIRAV